jgi:hypothetical protein
VSEGPSQSSSQMLFVLNRLARQGKIRLFEGVPAKVKARRRAASKVAKASRKRNRG